MLNGTADQSKFMPLSAQDGRSAGSHIYKLSSAGFCVRRDPGCRGAPRQVEVVQTKQMPTRIDMI